MDISDFSTFEAQAHSLSADRSGNAGHAIQASRGGTVGLGQNVESLENILEFQITIEAFFCRPYKNDTVC